MKALITGASSGMGRDMAKYLASLGWDLIIAARREDRLEALKQEIGNVTVRCIPCDVSDTDQCYQLYETTKDENIDMLVNNAGFGMFGAFDELSLEEELRLLDTNIKAVHILTKLYLRDFLKKDKGYILNVASIAGFLNGPLMASYYASKNYVVRLTEAIYQELKQKNSRVSVSVFCPGPVRTEFDKVANVKFMMPGLESEAAARYAVNKALKGKLIIIPGTLMKLAKFGTRLISEKATGWFSYHIQKRKNE